MAIVRACVMEGIFKLQKKIMRITIIPQNRNTACAMKCKRLFITNHKNDRLVITVGVNSNRYDHDFSYK